jgi:hypothetical protein
MADEKVALSDNSRISQRLLDFIKMIVSLAFLLGIVVLAALLMWKVSIFAYREANLLLGYIEKLYGKGDLPLPLLISIITAIATITTAVATTLITKNNELRLQVRSEQREKKALIYEELTEFFFKIIFASKLKDKHDAESAENQEREIVQFLTSYTPKIIMWGSDEVLREFYLFRSTSLSTETDPAKVFDVIRKFEELLFSIRRDLGHKNRRLGKGNILGLFINDVEKLL